MERRLGVERKARACGWWSGAMGTAERIEDCGMRIGEYVDVGGTGKSTCEGLI